MLYANIIAIASEEITAVTEFLRSEYEREALDHPIPLPEYNAEAAGWAARTIYISSQLLLYRENKVADLPLLLPDTLEPNASAILSADLTLRFLPDLVKHLETIDPADELLDLLRAILHKWHYSGLTHIKDIQSLDFSVIGSNASLHQLYCDRIIKDKKLTIALHPVFREKIAAHLGIYAEDLWKEFTTNNITHTS